MQAKNRSGVWIKLTALAALISTITLLAAGCATVTVRKVPTPTQYSAWSDKQQAAADKMEGVRFYLPRPFVNVFESFPVATDIYIADGEVSPDGKYVVIKNVRVESGLAEYFAAPTEPGQTLSGPEIPASTIFRPGDTAVANAMKALTDGIKPQSAGPEATDEAKKAAEAAMKEADRAKKAAEDAQAAVERPAPEQSKTGVNGRTVTNSNGAFAFQPLRGNFDIIYLPDFDEQYVVSSQANLGNAQFEMNMGQGWSLQGFNSLTDNSELNKRIFGMIDIAMRIASSAGKAAQAALFPPGAAADAIGGVIRPQSAGAAAEGTLVPSTPVSLKIVVVHYAAKGLYPVIKPRELVEAPLSDFLIDLYARDTQSGLLRNFSPQDAERAIAIFERAQRRTSVPLYPYQYVSFNTFRYMAIEVLSPIGLPFGTLYDKTGTVGDPGDRRAIDDSDIIKRILERASQSGTDNRTTDAITADQNAAIKAAEQEALTSLNNAPPGGASGYQVAQVFIEPSVDKTTKLVKGVALSAKLSRSGAATAESEADFKKRVRKSAFDALKSKTPTSSLADLLVPDADVEIVPP